VYKKILIPTDDSKNSRKAIKRGLELGKEIGAEVQSIYVVDTSSFVSLPETMMWENVKELLEEEGKKTLEYVKRAAKKVGIDVKTILDEGSPAEMIVDRASKEKIDLIIMGTAGRKGLDRFFIGSISERVLRQAHCSVMIVK
jgi:nucleotide-binding universal stress UspA family protein